MGCLDPVATQTDGHLMKGMLEHWKKNEEHNVRAERRKTRVSDLHKKNNVYPLHEPGNTSWDIGISLVPIVAVPIRFPGRHSSFAHTSLSFL